MNIIQLISILIIVYILFLLFSNNSVEHFYKKKAGKAMKAVKKSAAKVKKAVKKTAAKAAKVVRKSSSKKKSSSKVRRARKELKKLNPEQSDGKTVFSVNSVVTFKNIKTLKDTINETQKLIDLTNKTSINLNEIIKINNMRDSKIDEKIKNAVQKKNFTVFLIKKTQAKINQLNNLIILVTNIMSVNTQVGKKQIDILNKKIKMQIFIINIYKNRTNSYICQTNNLFTHISEIYKNINDINTEIKNKTSNYESLVLLTNKTVFNTNFLINDINTQIIEDDRRIAAEAAAAEALAEAVAIAAEEAAADADAGEAAEAAEAAEGPELAEPASDAESASESDEVEEFVVESITLFEPIFYEKQNIIQNLKSTITSIIPVLNKDELVSPQFTEPNLNNLSGVAVSATSYMSPLPYTSLSSMNDIPTSNEYMLEYVAELELKPYLPIEENVPIPPNVNEADVLAENELIYELN
jgi:Sec-independent protein translocase protein TatA